MVQLMRMSAIAVVVFTSLGSSAALFAADAPLDFNRDIRPILFDNCVACHGPDAKSRPTDLRLDDETSAKSDLGGHFAIVPGKPLESEIWKRITSTDPDEVMPPRKSGRTVSAGDREKLRAWIEQGAKWQKHWSLVPPVAPKVPAVRAAERVRNPIDSFLLARLEREGMSFSPPAARATLIRRLSLDLTGLPPTPSEVDDFVADASADAYERLVDRLLASPRYGERQVLDWLDAARYSDTNGYQTDGTRTMWPWKDAVVASLNRNQPFDEWTIEQLAGDLLPNATMQQKIASGFHRNHMLNGEGGRIAEESRVEYVLDRVETTSTVWLGLTLGCCRCHNHKYDPFSQKEFYSLYAYFNSIDEAGNVDRGGNASPVMKITTPAQQAQVAAIQAQIDSFEPKLAAVAAPNAEELAAWEEAAQQKIADVEGGRVWQSLDPASLTSARGQTLEKRNDLSIFASGANPETDIYTLSGTMPPGNYTGLRLEALTDPSFTAKAHARSDSGNFVLTELQVEAAGQPAKFKSAKADYEQGGFPITAAYDGQNGTGWAVHKPGDMEHVRTAVLVFEGPLAVKEGTTLTFRLKFESPHKFHNLGRFRLSLTTAVDPNIPGQLPYPANIVETLRVAPEKRTDAQKKGLSDLLHEEKRKSLRDEQARVKLHLTDLQKSFVEVMVMAERAQPRPTKILLRGQYDKPGDAVTHGVPAQLHPLQEGAPTNRLGLARWIVDPKNPLTARVMVNRYWQSFFAVGLVKTTEDFGTQGEWPSHPELLDWLATEFARDWDVKQIHRLIVLSEAYRQSSHATPVLLEKDADNRLLARGPRLRLPTQLLRDQALAASGLLVERIGGAPVKPYQPPGLWEDFSFGQIRYQQDHGESLYRKSLYVFWRRSVAPTSFFDIGGRTVCSVKQPRTNTPLHALTMLNDTAYAEAARVFAERMFKEGGASDADRLAFGFRVVLARKPTAEELKVLEGTLQRARSQFAAAPEEAKKLVSVGEYPRDAKLDPIEHAAYTAVGSLLLNLDEAINRE